MFEKDGTISKMKQFDYKIHKYKPGKTILPENSADPQLQQSKSNEVAKSPRSKRRKATPSTPPQIKE